MEQENPAFTPEIGGDACNRAPFRPMAWDSLGAVTDGTSNTLGLAEFTRPPEGYSTNVKGGHIVVTFNPKTAGEIRSICLAATSDGKTLKTASPYDLPAAERYCRGNWIGYGRPLSQAITTVLPPNSPNCARTNDDSNWGIFAAGSWHSGGANGVFLDGSVRFITDTIDYGNSNAYQVESGSSEFGVLGAIGTHHGGESKHL